MGQLGGGGAHAGVDAAVDASGTTVISLSGEVDISNVAAIGRELEVVLATAPAVVVLDLCALTFIDSSGIALLLRSAGRVERLELRNPSGLVRRIIQATGLSDVLVVEP